MVAAMAALAGCGTSRNALDEQILASGQISAQTAADLKRGQALISEGNDEIALGEKEQKRARKLASSGDRHVSDGRRMVGEGETLVIGARQAFCARIAYQSEDCRQR